MLTAHHLLLKDYPMDEKEGMGLLNIQRRTLQVFRELDHLVYFIYLLMLFKLAKLF
jgi:hypothetical protein